MIFAFGNYERGLKLKSALLLINKKTPDNIAGRFLISELFLFHITHNVQCFI